MTHHNTRGGRREGAGRPPTLTNPKLVHILLEPRQISTLDALAAKWGTNRSAALRRLLDRVASKL